MLLIPRRSGDSTKLKPPESRCFAGSGRKKKPNLYVLNVSSDERFTEVNGQSAIKA
jgi:hypothetical protein